MRKYIFVTGGVCSSLGKGIAASSIGCLLESRGLNVRMVKVDPYINLDAGTMSPYQHGEVFVTDDGAETDLDLGNYSRFTSTPLSQDNSITTGQVYQSVITKERQGKYLGKCVQVVPHITDEIKRRIYAIGEKPEVDVTLVEIGGTVGDIESIPFLEAVRQIIHDKGKKNALSIHLTLVPTVVSGELKTKPTQHSVKEMREIGIQPDVLLCRAETELPREMRKKISSFTNIDFDAVATSYDVKSTIYEIPLIYKKQKIDEIIVDKLGLKCPKASLPRWETMIEDFKASDKVARIAMVGKYIELDDSYKSVDEALVHGGFGNKAKVKIIKVDSEELEKKENLDEVFADIDGIIVPGGFGQRGVEGMIKTMEWARTHKMPCFGICLGMQVMVIEYARNKANLEGANSTEFAPEGPNPVVSRLEEQVDVTAYGGTMRLGRSESKLVKNSPIHKIYGETSAWERHRHRYEVSNLYRDGLKKAGLKICGTTADEALVEAVCWPDHPWGIGVQYHPEFTSRPVDPNPLFKAFIKASLDHQAAKK